MKPMDLAKYRTSELEVRRAEDIVSLIPDVGGCALDVGALDGHYTKLLATRFDTVVALDLQQPAVKHAKVQCVSGNVTNLPFGESSFDFVLCAEVLEHVPGNMLAKACADLSRVMRNYLLIGVPYKQDIRIGRTTCVACGMKSPPWGHLNSFDEQRLKSLFPGLRIERTSFVGETKEATNCVAALLSDWAGNPYGNYSAAYLCVRCGTSLVPPTARSVTQKVLTKMAGVANCVTEVFAEVHPIWIHVLFKK
jgi:hypothetical protein